MTAELPCATIVVVMGVSGAGKSTVGRVLADRLGWPFTEGDDLHPAENVAALASGRPLTDSERMPWLHSIRDWMDRQATTGTSAVITCSALKRSYRDLLRCSDASVRFAHLDGVRGEIARRQKARSRHFMPASLVETQFADLEPLESDEPGMVVDVTHATPEQSAARIQQMLAMAPGKP